MWKALSLWVGGACLGLVGGLKMGTCEGFSSHQITSPFRRPPGWGARAVGIEAFATKPSCNWLFGGGNEPFFLLFSHGLWVGGNVSGVSFLQNRHRRH